MTAARKLETWELALRARSLGKFVEKRSYHLARVALRDQLARAGVEVSLFELRQWPRALQAASYLWAWNVERGIPVGERPWTVPDDAWRVP
jgi:hypothetical protein